MCSERLINRRAEDERLVSRCEGVHLIVWRSAVVTEAADDGNNNGGEKSKGVAMSCLLVKSEQFDFKRQSILSDDNARSTSIGRNANCMSV